MAVHMLKILCPRCKKAKLRPENRLDMLQGMACPICKFKKTKTGVVEHGTYIKGA